MRSRSGAVRPRNSTCPFSSRDRAPPAAVSRPGAITRDASQSTHAHSPHPSLPFDPPPSSGGDQTKGRSEMSEPERERKGENGPPPPSSLYPSHGDRRP